MDREVKILKWRRLLNFPSQMLGTRFFGDFYNSSTNQRPSIGGHITCRPIGIENFQNINKRWRYCTEKEEKWAKETKYSAVQLLTNNAFWREKNGGKKKKKMRERFHFWTWVSIRLTTGQWTCSVSIQFQYWPSFSHFLSSSLIFRPVFL